MLIRLAMALADNEGGKNMKQVDAVFKMVCEIRGSESFTEAVSLTRDEKQEVAERIVAGMRAGEVELSERAQEKYHTDAKLKSYVLGMINNHLRKDRRLNGGVTYAPKNPGSRAGSGDPVVRELKKLLKVVGDEERQLVQDEIDKRLSEIRAEKAKTVEIDTELLPESLRNLA